MEEWKTYKIGNLCSISSSKRIFAKEYQSSGIPFFRGKEIIEKQKGESVSTELYISKSRYDEIKNKFGVPKEGDMLLTSVGTLGIPYIVKNETFYFKDGNLTWFTDFKEINSKFLYYWFLSPIAKNAINAKAIGSTQKALTIDALSKFEIDIPNIDTQNRIVSILSSLDSKIELNRRINDNLEQQAQALFKAWFVDFEPFKGEKFVESQLGMIPKGWKVGTLSDLLDIRYGKDHKKLNDGNIPVYGSGGVMRLADGILYNGESVLIPRKGTLNNVLYVNCPFWTVDTMFYSIEKVPNVAKYCHLLLSKLDLASMNSGSAVPSMTTDILNKIQVIVANQDVFSSFNECISSLYLKAKINLDENKRLSETRDLLLPKLMSGGLIIKDLHS